MEDKMGAYAMHIKQEYNSRITILKLIVNPRESGGLVGYISE